MTNEKSGTKSVVKKASRKKYVNTYNSEIFPLGKPVSPGETIMLTTAEAKACGKVKLVEES